MEQVETIEITENLTQELTTSFDQETVYFKVIFLGGKFTLEKTFQNNFFGREKLDIAKKEFDTEDKVKKHFGIGD